MTDTTRDFLSEARAMLAGTTLLLPERAHLMALQAYWDSQCIVIANELELLKHKTLGM